MTRQWLSPPELLCQRHLLGEHFEAHIFAAKMEKSYSLEGFRRGSMFFGAEYVKFRHDLIVPLLKHHSTPLLLKPEWKEQYPLILPVESDIKKSLTDLLGRCVACKLNHKIFWESIE